MAKYREFHARSITDPSGFWAERGPADRLERAVQAGPRLLHNRHLRRWFVGGTTNLCHNAVDRHLAARGDQIPH